MKTIKTSELTGALLDYWVARAEGLEVRVMRSGCWTIINGRSGHPFMPSASWAQGGPIIERERIKLMPVLPTGKIWYGIMTRGASLAEIQVWRDQAEQPLVAAMRAYVASKFGDEVPDDAAGQEGEHPAGLVTGTGGTALSGVVQYVDGGQEVDL